MTQIAIKLIIFVAVCFASTDSQQRSVYADEKNEDDDTGLVFQQFSSLDFDWSDSTPIIDEDQTTEGKAKLRELEVRAAELYHEHKKLSKERRPLAIPRDNLLGECRQAQQTLLGAMKQGNMAAQTIAQLKFRKRATPAGFHPQIDAQLRNANSALDAAKQQAALAQDAIDIRQPKIIALNNQITPLDQRMLQLWRELEECRSQWCKIRQPALKYARGDYEGLRKVLDDWLVIDGLWPSAYVWGALCAYEIDDYEGAVTYIRKAEHLRTDVFYFPLPWPAVAASQALITRSLGGDASRNYGTFLDQATSRMNRLERSRVNNEWDGYFILARYYSEKDAEHAKAKACYEKALKHNPFCCCSKIGLARLQVTSSNEKVRDVESGLKTLEKLWHKTAAKSWRLAGDLARAYDAAGKTDDAKRMWSFVMESDATNEQKENLRQWLIAARQKDQVKPQ